jgi:uncharacterized protein with ATP-grasp and redox domains
VTDIVGSQIMASVAKLFGKKDPYEDVDVEKLLEQLSAEELEQLGEELIDPDVSIIAISTPV